MHHVAALCLAIIAASPTELSTYEIASRVTGCPEWVLRGLRYAESSYGVNIDHPDPLDKGDYGLHETRALHAERAAKWGEYNPYCPLDSAIIAGFIVMEQYRYFGSMVEAISAYRHGRLGVLRDGLDARYVRKVYHGGLTEL